MTKRIVRVGMIGSGKMAGIHSRCLGEIKNACLTVVFGDERSPGLAKKWGARYVDTIDELVSSEDVDAVIIATPHGVHCEQALKALIHNKHVMVEKPMALSLEDCDRMIETADNHNCKLFVGHTRHYCTNDIKTREILQRGVIGNPLMINSTCLGLVGPDLRITPKGHWLRDPKLSMGSFIGYGCHLVDKLIWWLNSDVIEVYAKFNNYWLDENVENGGCVTLTFDNGTIANIFYCVSSPESMPRGKDEPSFYPDQIDDNKIIGEKGLIQCEFYGELKVRTGNDWQILNKVDISIPDWSMNFYLLENQDFINCIYNDKPSPIDGRYARKIVEVCLAAYKSSETGEKVILKKFV